MVTTFFQDYNDSLSIDLVQMNEYSDQLLTMVSTVLDHLEYRALYVNVVM